MNKTNSTLLSIIFVLAIVVVGLYLLEKIKQVEEPFGVAQHDITKSATATSSPTTIATSTDNSILLTAAIPESATNLYLDMQVTASSTATAVWWEYEYSSDRIDWYGERVASSTLGALGFDKSVVVYSPATTSNQWTPGETSLMKATFKVPIVDNFVRVKAIRGASFENFQIWAQLRPITLSTNR